MTLVPSSLPSADCRRSPDRVDCRWIGGTTTRYLVNASNLPTGAVKAMTTDSQTVGSVLTVAKVVSELTVIGSTTAANIAPDTEISARYGTVRTEDSRAVPGAMYYRMPDMNIFCPLRTACTVYLTEHARIHFTRTSTSFSSLRVAVDNLLDFCAIPQCAFSVKEHLFTGKGAWVRIPQF